MSLEDEWRKKLGFLWSDYSILINNDVFQFKIMESDNKIIILPLQDINDEIRNRLKQEFPDTNIVYVKKHAGVLIVYDDSKKEKVNSIVENLNNIYSK